MTGGIRMWGMGKGEFAARSPNNRHGPGHRRGRRWRQHRDRTLLALARIERNEPASGRRNSRRRRATGLADEIDEVTERAVRLLLLLLLGLLRSAVVVFVMRRRRSEVEVSAGVAGRRRHGVGRRVEPIALTSGRAQRAEGTLHR